MVAFGQGLWFMGVAVTWISTSLERAVRSMDTSGSKLNRVSRFRPIYAPLGVSTAALEAPFRLILAGSRVCGVKWVHRLGLARHCLSTPSCPTVAGPGLSHRSKHEFSACRTPFGKGSRHRGTESLVSTSDLGLKPDKPASCSAMD